MYKFYGIQLVRHTQRRIRNHELQVANCQYENFIRLDVRLMDLGEENLTIMLEHNTTNIHSKEDSVEDGLLPTAKLVLRMRKKDHLVF